MSPSSARGWARASLVSLLATLWLVSTSAPALACECVRQELTTQYVPFAGSRAPPNVVPRVLLYFGHTQGPEVWPDLRVLCSKAGQATIHASTSQRQLGYRMGMVSLHPRQALPSGATCGLVDRERRVVNWFVVADVPDLKAPRAPIISGGLFASGGHGMCGARAANGGLSIEVDPAEPGFENRLYGVWLGVEGQQPNYAEPPLTVSLVDSLSAKPLLRHARVPGINFDLSAVSECKPSTFPYPEQRTAILGIKALDLAGNWSPPSQVLLEGVATAARQSYSWGRLRMGTPAAEQSHAWLWFLLALLGLPAAVLVYAEATNRELL